MNWWRTGVVALLVGAAVWIIAARLTVEDDPLRSLNDRDAEETALFERFHAESPFQGELFVEMDSLPQNERRAFDAAIAQAGYRPVGAGRSFEGLLGRLVELAPAVLEEKDIEETLSPSAIGDRASEILMVATLPGSSALFETLAEDPLGLAKHVRGAIGRTLGRSRASASPTIRVYESPRPLSYEKVGELYDRWVGISNRVHAISGDFFALANFRAIRRDIVVCTAVALPLNFVLFWIFVRRWNFLAFLFVGSIVSYAAGLFALSVSAGPVFTLVLVFTSTLVSFNNEYLVHLCGLDPSRSSENRLSLGSAIGTTFIGFVALLFASAVIIRQIALVSIGGMIGFLLFLFAYRDVLSRIHLRTWRWPMLSLSKQSLLAGSVAVICILFWLGMPTLRTRVESFGVREDHLQREAEYFGARAEHITGETILAVEVREDPGVVWEAIKRTSGADLAPHPLLFLRSGEEQQRNAAFLKQRYNEAVELLRERLERGGIRLPSGRLPPSFGVQNAAEFLHRTGDLWPSPTWIEDGGRRWLVIGVHEADADKAEKALAGKGRRVTVLNPKIHYDRLLTGISAQLLALFVAGLVGIGAYLIALQRRVFRLLYVTFPLGLALAAFLAWIRWVGPYEVNFIHLTAFALVISLAVDYTCIAVSTGFGELERTKILVTGLSTVASFGILMAARHPVLRAIGATVTLGCGVSLVFALFVRLKEDA